MNGVQTGGDVDVDIGRLFQSLAERWRRIVLVAVIVAAGALLATSLATSHYKAETRILIETRESPFTRTQANPESDRPLLDEEGVTSQVEVIASTDILKQVAAKLDLSSRPEFDEAADLSLLDRVMIVAGLKSDPAEIPPEERVLKAFREKLTVYRVEKSRVIVIEMSSEDPKLAAAIPNAMADAYLAVQSAAKRESNADATAWLEPEIASLSQRVKEAEAKVAAFRGQSDLLIGQNNSVLATQQLTEISTELSRVRANRAAAEATAESVRAALRNGGSLDALPEVMSSGLIQRLRERQVQLNTEIAELSTTLLDNHPRIRALRSQLSDLDRQIRGEAQNILRGLSTEATTAQARESQLVAEVNRLKAESARAGEQEVELRALEREANAQRELLESYLARYREAASRRDGNYLPADARIFSRAVPPAEPYFPKVLPIVGAAFVGAMLIMALMTLVRELFSGRAMRPAGIVVPEPIDEIEMAPVAPPPSDVTPSNDDAAPVVRLEVHGPTGASAIQPVREQAEAPAVEAPAEVTPVAAAVPAEAAKEEAAEPQKPEPAAAETKEVNAPIALPVRRPVELPAWRRRETFREEWEKHKRALAEAEALRGESEDQDMRNPISAARDFLRQRFEPRRQFAGDNPATLGEIDVVSAAEKLIAGGASRAIFVSPQGDDGAASAVLVAREVADAGLRVLLMDLTASGAASRPMLENAALPGITNLLASQAQFTDVIHQDHYSDCHVIPVGTANPMRAMRAADRLPIIMESLTTAYDVVIVECGPTDAEGIRRLVADDTEILVSVLEPNDEIAEAAAGLKAGGYDGLTLVTPAGYVSPDAPVPGRSAA